jgi:hypothetical protein
MAQTANILALGNNFSLFNMPIVQRKNFLSLLIFPYKYGIGMMDRNKSAPPQVGQSGDGRSRVDILFSKVSQLEEGMETIVLYGFVHDNSGQVSGFTLSCTVLWRVDDYSLDSGDAHTHSYFSNLVEGHVDARLFPPDAAIEMTFTDPELKEPIGFGFGFLKLQGSLLN